MPGDAYADLVIDAADPVELAGVELGLGRAKQRIECGAATDDPEGGAVLGRDIVEGTSNNVGSRRDGN